MVLCLPAFTSLFHKYKYLVKASAQSRAAIAVPGTGSLPCAQQNPIQMAEYSNHQAGD